MGESAREHRMPRRVLLWAGIGVAVVAVAVLAATGRFRAQLIPKTVAAAQPVAVQCYDADGNQGSGWLARGEGTPTSPRVDPVAICDGLARDAMAVARMDRIATQQRALGHDCATFGTTDDETWYLTALTTSPNGTYTASGGPAPGVLPDYGVVEQPAPLVGIPRVVPLPAGCVRLPTMSWKFSVPPMAACTTDGLTVSVYPRSAHATAQAVCAAKHLTVAQR